MITGSITVSDYLNGVRLHRAKSLSWYYAASGIAIAIGIADYFLFQRKFGIILGCAGVGGLIGELAMSSLYLRWKVRRLRHQQKDFDLPFTYAWDSEFLNGQGANGSSKRRWSDYLKYKENEKIFLLYHSDVLFEMFPKNWFQDQIQIAEFRKLAQRAGKI